MLTTHPRPALQIVLTSPDGKSKYSTECAPHNGYYFLPVDDEVGRVALGATWQHVAPGAGLWQHVWMLPAGSALGLIRLDIRTIVPIWITMTMTLNYARDFLPFPGPCPSARCRPAGLVVWFVVVLSSPHPSNPLQLKPLVLHRTSGDGD